MALRFTYGVKASFKFQIETRQEASAHTISIQDSESTEPIFSKLYGLLRVKKNYRSKILSEIVSLLANETDLGWQFSLYAAEVIMSLNFYVMDECLTILQVIDKMLPLIMDNCRNLLKEKEQEFYKTKKVKISNSKANKIKNSQKSQSQVNECDMEIDDVEEAEELYENVLNKNASLNEQEQYLIARTAIMLALKRAIRCRYALDTERLKTYEDISLNEKFTENIEDIDNMDEKEHFDLREKVTKRNADENSHLGTLLSSLVLLEDQESEFDQQTIMQLKKMIKTLNESFKDEAF